MMTKRTILLLMLVIILIVVTTILYIKASKSYITSFNGMQNIKVRLFRYDDPFIDYFNEFYQYPESLDSLLEYGPSKGYNYLRENFKDLLSDGKGLIKYIPLQDSTGLNISYLLVSTGIDGKFNNNYDNIHSEKDIDNLDFYNDSIISRYVFYNDEPDFCLWDYYFGRKDYLIVYRNGKRFYQSQVINIYSLNEMIEKILDSNFRKRDSTTISQVFCFQFPMENVSSFEDGLINITSDNGYNLKCIMNPEVIVKNELGRRNTLYGFLTEIHPEAKKIVFENCFMGAEFH